jgi:hypothetical protein
MISTHRAVMLEQMERSADEAMPAFQVAEARPAQGRSP